MLVATGVVRQINAVVDAGAVRHTGQSQLCAVRLDRLGRAFAARMVQRQGCIERFRHEALWNLACEAGMHPQGGKIFFDADQVLVQPLRRGGRRQRDQQQADGQRRDSVDGPDHL
jgi:hypothetical protein